MPITECELCGNRANWRWEEAFDKFGFNDGDGDVRTKDVFNVLQEAGYTPTETRWGWHNTVITSIKTPEGKDLIDRHLPRFGYDCPRTYLPEAIIELLDEKLPEE